MQDNNKNNYVELVGKLPFDIKLFTTAGGKVLTNFKINVDNKRGKGYTQIPVVAWEENAKDLADNFRKNDKIKVIGEISTSSYQKEGNTIVVFQVVVNSIEPIGSKKELESNDFGSNSGEFVPNDLITDDDLPF